MRWEQKLLLMLLGLISKNLASDIPSGAVTSPGCVPKDPHHPPQPGLCWCCRGTTFEPKNTVGRSECVQEHTKLGSEQPQVIYLDFSLQCW